MYSQTGYEILIDHTCCKIEDISQSIIENARDNLHIVYAHTSHGSQLIWAMISNRLGAFSNAGGKGISLPLDLLVWDDGITEGTLDLRDYLSWGDRGNLVPEGANDLGNPNHIRWSQDTRTYLGYPDPVTGRGTNNQEINVIMWAWCGQSIYGCVAYYYEG